MADKDEIAEAKEAFDKASEAEHDNRQAWLDDFKFARLGDQWPIGVKRQRELEGRPCLTINRLPAFIRQVTNDARLNKPGINVHPVGEGANKETAEVLSGLIRNIEYTSDAEVAYDTALDHAVTGGFGYIRISTDYADDDAFDQDIRIERVVNPLTIYGDPASTASDSSDWNVAFVTENYTKAEFEKRWSGAVKADWHTDYKDMNDEWCNGEMVRVAEWWTREDVPTTLLKLSDGMVMHEPEYLKVKEILDSLGITVVQTRPTVTKKVKQRIITGAEVLETNDWAGRYIPIVPVYGDELNIEGKRHFISLIRHAKDPQQMFNFWRTSSTELVALAPKAPFIGPRGAFNSDSEKWATANVVSHPYIEYDGGTAPQRQPFAGPPAGALQEALNAQDDMKSIMGIFDASLGARSNETSGLAINARQREGDIATFNYIDNLSRAIRHTGRILVDLIPKVYSTERIIRVIHEDETTENVPINQPIPQTPQQIKEAQEKAEDEREDAQGMVKIYDLTTGKYDVTVSAGPSFTTQRQEAAVQMMDFVRAFPPAAGAIGDLLAKNMDWPGADEIAERLEKMLPPPLQKKNPQLMQMQQQLQMQDQAAKQAIAQLQRELQTAKTDKQSEMIALKIKEHEAQIKAFDAETKRIQAMQLGISPDQLQAMVAQMVAQMANNPDILQIPNQLPIMGATAAPTV